MLIKTGCACANDYTAARPWGPLFEYSTTMHILRKNLRISIEARDTEHTALKVDVSQRTIEAGTDDLLRKRITIGV